MTSSKAKADAVKTALVSTSTCTTATVVSLKELLLPDTEASAASSQTTSRTAKSTTNSKAKKGASSRAKTPVTASGGDQLSTKDRAALATHVINFAIKALSEAAKPAPPSTPAKRQPSHGDLQKAPAPRTLRRSLSAPLSPLHPRTLNRVATSPNVASKGTSSQPTGHSPGCLATVEAARTAFACLRSIKGTPQPNQTDFQLETGMSALIGKLLALGLQEPALKELRILKRRLDSAISADTSKSAKPASEGQSASQIIAELLVFDGSIPNHCLAIVTTVQLQILRLIAASKKPAQIEASLPFLLESHPSSPIRLFQKLAEQSEKEGQKAARQLASLSQLLLSLAPSVSSREDTVATEPRLSPSPITAFKLQVLCFTAQLRWWKLAGHRGVVDDEILSPFARCLRALTRRHTSGQEPTYDMIASASKNILALVHGQPSLPKSTSDSPSASIYQILGAAAHQERHYDDAYQWFEKLRDMLRPEQDSVLKIYSTTARLLAAAIKKTKIENAAETLAKEVVDGLDGSLSGNIAELNELLESLSLARRSAVGLLASKLKGSTQDSHLIDHLKSLVIRYPRFSRRWLGAPPGKEASAKHILQFDQRKDVVMQTLTQVLDAALMVVNVDLQAGTVNWQLMDETLQDCTKLLTSVSDPTMSNSKVEQLGSYYVKISSLYFFKFSQLRKDTSKSKEVNKQILQALNRSIEVVKERSPAQQEKAQLSTKLELFADLCKGAGRGNDAVRTLRSICTNMVEEGALLNVTAALASQPPVVAWGVDEKAETLSRTLRSIAKLDQSWNDWTFFLPEAERAAVLEHLMQISAGSSSKSQPLQLHDQSVEALLRLYTVDRYPVRRLRVLLYLLSQNLGEERQVEEIMDLVADVFHKLDAKSPAEDGSLLRYVPHLRAFHGSLSALAIVDGSFPVTAINEALAAWTAMTKSCSTRDDILDKIDNPDGLLAHLQSAGQFASLKGENNVQLSILELSATISKALTEPTYNNVILNHALLAAQHLNIGHYSEAKKTLELAEEFVEQAEGTSRGTIAAFHLSQAEYFAGIGSIEEANSSLEAAKEMCDGSTSSWAASKLQANISLALVSFLSSTLALKQGHVQEALSDIKASVRILSHDWAKLESAQSRSSSPSADPNSSVSSIGTIQGTTTPGQVIGPRFWALAFPLIRGLLHTSSVYAHLGMFQETIYYSESAQKIAESTASPLYRAQVLGWMGSVYHRASRLEKALELGNVACDLIPEEACSAKVHVACQLGDMYRDLGEEDKASELLRMAESSAQLLGNREQAASVPKETVKATKAAARGRAATAAKSTRGTRTTRTRAATATATTTTRKRALATKSASTPSEDALTLPKNVYQASLLASVILSRALGFISRKDWSSALSVLEQVKELPKMFGILSQEQVATALSLIGHSMEQMIHDPVFSVIQDSTISFPAVSGSEKSGSGRTSLSQTPPRKGRAASKDADVPAFADALKRAQELLLEAHGANLSTANSTMVHRISALLQSTVILLSATSAQSKFSSGSAFATVSVDLARNITWRREQSTLDAKKDASLAQAAATSLASRRASLGLSTEMAKFQKNYVELVPQNWSVISVSLSDNHHDLCITKFQAGHSPFILRLPLERANSRDADSEVFNFEHGREEMMEIIQLANETSHSAGRDFSAKGAKNAWWAEREELDCRLRDLLSTIETTWLGGFKGIFSQHERRPDLLARFQKSFQQMLDGSLPSRSRTARGKRATKTPKVSLDPRILDLFIGLGDPSDPDCDFDEALNDLLYFVVDILQFHGERNAYDEIDFDAMVVETYDALRGYHEAAKSGAEPADGAHTVLVLDKALHAFPWESMPCMEGLAVSRVPSLACLRQLILDSKATRSTSDNESADEATSGGALEGQYVSAEHGTYILNPSTDLKNTQATFQSTLKTLSSWTGIVHRAPEESEFETALSKSDILLYFGHGSGAQYVRARTVRRLPKCRPATFLMGCSSASLTTAGEFESYGPVWNYMMAGCPAVVGTLWDVTDRDIDRFAGRSFEEWGLFPRGTFAEKGAKAKATEEDSTDENDGQIVNGVSLVEAVARARKACRFKYLNAAAVVLYGIPVYINRES